MTCGPRGWTSRWPSTASRPSPCCRSAGPAPPGRGLRSSVADGELAIGFDDAVPGFFWLVGQGGDDIQSAAGAAALAAALITRQPVPDALLAALRAEGTGVDALAVQRLRP